jgi:hypothetical protein
MLRLPFPDLLSVDRANFDACANKIPIFLLFQQEVMGDRVMARSWLKGWTRDMFSRWPLVFKIIKT